MDEVADGLAVARVADVWPAPAGGWVDAWNGWYPTRAEAVEAAADGVADGRVRVLAPGEDIITEDLADIRREHPAPRPRVAWKDIPRGNRYTGIDGARYALRLCPLTGATVLARLVMDAEVRP